MTVELLVYVDQAIAARMHGFNLRGVHLLRQRYFRQRQHKLQ